MNELRHHGILGQKWGVRRFQNLDGSLTSAGRERYRKSSGSKTERGKEFSDRYLRKYGKSAFSEMKDRLNGRRDFKRYMNEMIKQSEYKSLDQLPKMEKKTSTSENMKLVNPDYSLKDESTYLNCMPCVTAMVMREKGYDVEAIHSTEGFYDDIYFKKTFKAETEGLGNIHSQKDLLNSLASYGDGAYGGLSFDYKKENDGHIVFWKNERGKTRIYDGQISEEYTSNVLMFSMFYSFIDTDSIGVTRLDNVEPTKYAASFVKPRNKD